MGAEMQIFYGAIDPFRDGIEHMRQCMTNFSVPVSFTMVEGCGHGDLPMCIINKPEYCTFVKFLNKIFNDFNGSESTIACETLHLMDSRIAAIAAGTLKLPAPDTHPEVLRKILAAKSAQDKDIHRV